MGALNELAFDATARFEADRGMWAVQRIHLRAAQRLYRLGSSDHPERWYTSGWWLEYEHFHTVRDYARRAKLSVGYAARRCLALMYEWGKADVLVSALLVQPLDAYGGRGRVQARDRAAEGGLYTWYPPPSIRQLYIPGLAAGPARSEMSLKAFADLRHESVTSGHFS
jgi:hypothetical protein